MNKNSKKHLFIGLPTYIVAIAIIVLLCLFVPKACKKKDNPPVNTYKVEVTCSNCTINGETTFTNTYQENEEAVLTFKNDADFALPNDVKATMDNHRLIKDTDYSYNRQTGKMNFKVIGNTNIAIVASGYNMIFKSPGTEQIVGFECEGSFESVDWGDGIIDSNKEHTYSAAPEGTEYFITFINSNMTSFKLVKSMWTPVKEGNAYITKIIFPTGVTSIGYASFHNCESLSSVVIPNSATLIDGWAFANCPLTSITIPNSVTSIGSYAFLNCYLPTIDLPNSITSISSFTFHGCKLVSIDIPNSVTEIFEEAFRYCSLLSSVTIPNSIASIKSYVFGNCTSLASVFIPNSVIELGSSVFQNCSSLETIYCEAPSKPTGWFDGWIGDGCRANVVWDYHPSI